MQDGPEIAAQDQPAGPAAPEQTAPERPLPPLYEVTASGTDSEIVSRLQLEINRVVARHPQVNDRYVLLALYDTRGEISNWEANRVFQALTAFPAKERDVLLFMVHRGGSVEPAYQISKLCKVFARDEFGVVVPRIAKSAATLIALGADHIHMGLLGELGPIDPQIGGLPALGVAAALERFAALAEKHPGSSEMIASYLRQTLTVEQVGYFDRICESAEQYAERLLTTKEELAGRAKQVAKSLVHEYKDHRFVIDRDEAKELLGAQIIGDSAELAFGEELFARLDMADVFLRVDRNKHLEIAGSLQGDGVYVWDLGSASAVSGQGNRTA